MRYKNLTITITLGCLSIVALAGLVMLPITGNCELRQYGWTPYNNNTAANITVTEDTQGASWQVRSSVDAKVVSASITPDDHNLSHFTEDKIFTGTGLVSAYRQSYNFTHSHTRHFSYSYWHTHIIPGDIDINHKGSSYYNGEDDALTLDIQANAKVEKHTCWAHKKETNVGITVTLGKDADIVEAESEFKVGQTTYVAINDSVKVYVYIPVVAQEVGVEASVPFDKRAGSAAQTYFYFSGHQFDRGFVRYTAP